MHLQQLPQQHKHQQLLKMLHPLVVLHLHNQHPNQSYIYYIIGYQFVAYFLLVEESHIVYYTHSILTLFLVDLRGRLC